VNRRPASGAWASEPQVSMNKTRIVQRRIGQTARGPADARFWPLARRVGRPPLSPERRPWKGFPPISAASCGRLQPRWSGPASGRQPQAPRLLDLAR